MKGPKPSSDGVPLLSPAAATAPSSKRGSWNAFPFIIGAVVGLSVAGGWRSNLQVFLMYQFDVKSIQAAQIVNVISGSTTLVPVAAAIVSDSFLGCFPVIWAASLINMLGILLLLLTVTVDVLLPSLCGNNCPVSSDQQYAFLYLSLVMSTIGAGGTSYTVATFGASQFTDPNEQNSFFNWYFFTTYTALILTSTGIVYVEENVSWAWGYGLCLAANAIGLAVFLVGRRYYYCEELRGSPLTSLVRVIVASARKRRAVVSWTSEDYYCGDVGDDAIIAQWPSTSLRWLNRAALKSEGDILENGSVARQWRICSVEQVEDLKTIMKILPLWSSSILLATTIGVQMTLSVLQALAMDRHVGRQFQTPAGWTLVVSLFSSAVCLGLFDYFLWPVFKKVFRCGRDLTPLHRLGIGHILNAASMAISAVVESKRLVIASQHHPQSGETGQLSVFWLVPQLVVVGIGEAFHYPGQIAFYYQEFPNNLKNMSTAMISLLIGLAFYLSSGVIYIVGSVTKWLPDKINDGRVDNVYWVLVVVGILNFGYYLLCSCKYRYRNPPLE